MTAHNGNGLGTILNRVGMWSTLVGLAIYVLNMGMWVGAADEKFESAEQVEKQVDEVKERLTKLETAVELNTKTAEKNTEAILKAIEKLESKTDE